MRLYQLLCLTVCVVSSSLTFVCAMGDEPAAGKQVEQSFKTKDGADVPYLLYLPDEYDGKSSLPVMLFLHGRGESDGPLSVVAKWGPPQMLARGDKLPFIVISPQCPKTDAWRSDTQQGRLDELLMNIVEKYHGDKSRIYLTALAWAVRGHGGWRPVIPTGSLPLCRFAVMAVMKMRTS